MKTAVFLSGMPGNLDFSLEQIKKHILDPLDADLFIYFWHTELDVNRGNESRKVYDKNFTEFIIETSNINPVDTIVRDFEEMRSDFEKMAQTETMLSAHNGLGYLPSYFSQWYCVKQAFNRVLEYEKENNIKYDRFVRIRTEIEFFDEPITEESLEHIEKRLIIPLGYGDGGKHRENLQGINDFMAFGNRHDMQIYTSLYDFIPEYSKELKFVHSETQLLHHLLKNDIKILRINLPGQLCKENVGFPWPVWSPEPEFPGHGNPIGD